MKHGSLEDFSDTLIEKGYTYYPDRLFFPHDVNVSELGIGKTRQARLRELGIPVNVVPLAKKVDQIAASRALLPRCRFDTEKARVLVDRLQLYSRKYDPVAKIYSKEPTHDINSHGADAFHCLAVGFREVGYGPPSGMRLADGTPAGPMPGGQFVY